MLVIASKEFCFYYNSTSMFKETGHSGTNLDSTGLLCGILPVFLGEFNHHGRQLVQNKHARQALVSDQPVGHFLVSGDGELVCFYHLRNKRDAKGQLGDKREGRQVQLG